MEATQHRPRPRPAKATTPNRNLRHHWLPLLFWLWIGGAMLVGGVLALGGPLAPFTGLERHYLALAVVPFLMLMLASGLVWLVLMVNTPPRRR